MALDPPADPNLVRRVGCDLVFAAAGDVVLCLAVAVGSTTGEILEERFDAQDSGGRPVAVQELVADHGGRVHVLTANAGPISVSYAATVKVSSAPWVAGVGAHVGFDDETIVALRQSRYCPSDELAGFAAGTFARRASPAELAHEVASWVFERLAYVGGASGPFDTAVDTLLAGAGVCRDYAHLAIALCRALGIPARQVSAYAPGLSPMDFHAVVEIYGENGWEILDPTRLAPRSTLVRIATGRDSADTAFATTLRGELELVSAEITAVSDGWLPNDDHTSVARLP